MSRPLQRLFKEEIIRTGAKQMMCCRTYQFRFSPIHSLIRRGFKLQKEWRHVLLNCPFVHLSVCMFVRLTICPFVCLSDCLFVCLSVCLFDRLSVCPFDQALKKENRKLRKTNSISSSSCLQPKSQSRLQKTSAIIFFAFVSDLLKNSHC